MTRELTAIAIAVGSTSLICFVLMARLERRRNGRRTVSDGGGSEGGTFAGGDSGRAPKGIPAAIFPLAL
jgi:hypothetical protein